MPYIKKNDRNKFENSIKSVVSILKNGHESLYVKGEYFGYFVNRIVRKFLHINEEVDTSFNAVFFIEENKSVLRTAADRVSALVNKSDPINSVGELNYAISAVLTGFIGKFTDADTAKYGVRAYLHGILDAIIQDLKPPQGGSQADRTQYFRRTLIVRGMIADVVSEMYRRYTASYEEIKMEENGDIWNGDQLVLEG